MRLRIFNIVLALLGCSLSCMAMARSADLSAFTANTMAPLTGFGQAIYGICYVAGTAFFLGALLQYKYHRENRQQVKISTPIVLLAVSVILFALPFIAGYSSSGQFLK